VKTKPVRFSALRILSGCLAIAASIILPWNTAAGYDLESLGDSIDEHTDLLEISATTIAQTTLNEGDSSGSYEVDIIGSYRLLKRDPGQLIATSLASSLTGVCNGQSGPNSPSICSL
jgi:hypothetical protein